MEKSDMRAAITQAKFNEEKASWLSGQILIVSVLLGLGTKSWWVFGIVSIGLMICLSFRRLAIIICVAFALGWGAIGFVMGTEFEPKSMGARIVLSILGFMCGLGANFAGLQWSRDLANTDDNGDDDNGDYDDYDGDYDDNMFCQKCGNQVAESAAFCQKCGMNLHKERADTTTN